MKENGKTISNMEEDMNNILMALPMKVTMLMVNQKVWENLHGKMEKYMKVNGKMGKNMEVEFGKATKETHILVNGN